MNYLMTGLLVILAGAAMPAMAQEETMRTLTPVKIRAFIDKMTEKTKPGGRLGDQDVVAYLDAHLADDGQYASYLTFRIPGFDDQTQEVFVDKEQFIRNILSGRQDIRDYDSSVKVMDVEVAKDKQTATIKTLTKEEGMMPVEEGRYVPFEGQSECQQQIRLQGNIPQILSASCQSLIEIKNRIKG